MAEKKEPEFTQQLIESFSESNKAIAENIIAAQQNSMKFAQSTFSGAMEVFKNQADAMRNLMHQLEQQAQTQQEAFQKMAQEMGGAQWMESYKNFLRTGFSSYQQALDAAEKATRQGMENFEKATEAIEKAAQQLPKMPGAQRTTKPPTP